MFFSSPLIKGVLIKRYKRFMADIQLENGDVVTAHCANSGAMLGLTTPGAVVWVSFENAPQRKLKYSWHIIEVDQTCVGVNTFWPNSLIEEWIVSEKIPWLKGYSHLRREVKYGKNSRIDILLQSSDKPDCYVEVKNVHLKRGNIAFFPDSVTTRGAKHLAELSDVVQKGQRAVMIYVIQRNDCSRFSLAEDIDPAYAIAARKAFDSGVEAYACTCRISPQSIELDRFVEVFV